MSVSHEFPIARTCLRFPIPEIAQASEYLNDAVTAHLSGDIEKADRLIRLADMPVIREWSYSLWGKASPYLQFRKVFESPQILKETERAGNRMPSQAMKLSLLKRDGYHCRFCGIPVIRSETRAALQKLYPDALQWPKTSANQHAAFQTMWVQYDHLLPHSRGGATELGNLVIACASCNYGRWHYTLAEVGLDDPRNRAPSRSKWDGLERLTRPTATFTATAGEPADLKESSLLFETTSMRLEEGMVDPKQEHFELRYGPADQSLNDWIIIALVAAPADGVIMVQLIDDRHHPVSSRAIEKTWKDIRFYLQELNGDNPWLYAQYHCETAANVYSDVHWRFVTNGASG